MLKIGKEKEKGMDKQKRNFKKTKKSVKGITLIALVITIIVLLILAGVSIATLTGDNGILTRAQEAKNKTEQAEKDEEQELIEQDGYIEAKLGKNYANPYIPNGFEHIGDEIWNQGYVIMNINTKDEYVWIPVEDYNEFVENKEYKKDSISDIDTDTIKNTYGTINKEHYQAMLDSIKKYGGFYIGRYEAGIDNYRTEHNENLPIPKSQASLYPYNFVTRDEAQTLSMSVDSGDRTSSLMYYIQWCAILRFINKYSNNIINQCENFGNFRTIEISNNELDQKNLKYSLDYGMSWEEKKNNFIKEKDKCILLTTGASSRNKALQIYDISGNVWEWILSSSNGVDTPYIRVGGGYANSGTSYSLDLGFGFDKEMNSNDSSFRISIW